jgi:peroxiredoxin
MKSILLTIGLLAACIVHGHPPKKGDVIIHGVIKNVRESFSYIYLVCIGGKCLDGDSIKVVNNKYTCSIHTDYVAMLTFYTKPFSDPAFAENKNYFMILAEPGNCNIVSLDSFSNISVSGSLAYNEDKKLTRTRSYYSSEIQRLRHITDSLENSGDAADSAILRLDRQINSLYKKIDRLYPDYAGSYPSSLIAPFLLSIYFDHVSDSEVIKNAALYDRLPAEGKNSYFGNDIKSRIESAKIGIGTMAPEFTQADTAGNIISLQLFRGKYVLIDFWASWCLPCRGENEHLVKAFNDYHKNGFTIISISVDEAAAKDKWLKAIHNDGLTWTNISDLKGFENAAAKLYYVTAVPQNFLIDPEGKIIAKNLRNGSLEKKLNEIFSSK